MEEEAARTYAEEDAPETKTHDFNAAFEATTCAASFVEHDLAGAKIGARVMYTQDMTPIPPEACDNDFRAEAGYCDKSQIDAIRSKRAPGGRRARVRAVVAALHLRAKAREGRVPKR